MLETDDGKIIAEMREKNLSTFRRVVVAQHPQWGLLLDWYAHMETGAETSFFGNEPKDERGYGPDLQIALAEDEFWEDKPDDVMAEIARIVGWPERFRQKSLAAYSSPQVTADEHGRLDAIPNPIFDAPEVDAELLNLPGEQLSYLRVLEAAVAPGGKVANFASSSLVISLKEYKVALYGDGVQPAMGALKGQFSIMEIGALQIDREKAWPDDVVAEAWKHVAQTHEKLLQHYPMDAKRLAAYQTYSVETSKLDTPEIREKHLAALARMKEVQREGFATEEYVAVIQAFEVEARVLASVPETAGPVGAKVEEARKTSVLRKKGFIDATIDRANKVTKLVESDTVQVGLGQMKSWGDALGALIKGGGG
ncbi:MAG: hypothetical protein AAFQ10_12475 [Pseudomonadota bacterium]